MSIRSVLQDNLNLSDEKLMAFEKFADFLKEKNKQMNLTAITDDDEIAVKHFLDSLSLYNALDIRDKSKIIDIGTGAGFPSVPLLIYNKTLKITMVDSLGKRLRFIDEALEKLDLTAETIHARAEDLGRDPEYREKYDFAVSRAVAGLNVLVELCVPFIKAGGIFAAMKGPEAENEISAAKSALDLLGAEVTETKSVVLPGDLTRKIIVIQKVRETDERFPRTSKNILKRPL